MPDNNEKYKRIIFSPVAGAIEAIIMQPIDTIKVKAQSNQFSGTFKLIKTKGVRSLYKGLTPYISQMSIKYALRFSTFEMLKSKDGNKLHNFGAGVTAGFVESLFITPFELIKTNLQVRDSLTDPLTAVNRVRVNDGILGLYRGFSSTCFRQCINQGTNFTVYIALRDYIYPEGTEGSNQQPSVLKTSGISFISSSIGPLLNNPFDVVKTRFQNPAYNGKYSSTFDCLRVIAREEGVPKLYKGIYLRILRVSGGQIIIFNVIEQLSYLTRY